MFCQIPGEEEIKAIVSKVLIPVPSASFFFLYGRIRYRLPKILSDILVKILCKMYSLFFLSPSKKEKSAN